MDVATASFVFTAGFIILLIYVLSLWQVFYKAGYEGWKSIIPIYNTYILTKIGNQPLWVFILLFIPFLNIIAAFMLAVGISKAFGKGTGFGVILFIFQFFGYMYLGWGDSEYQEQTSDSSE